MLYLLLIPIMVIGLFLIYQVTLKTPVTTPTGAAVTPKPVVATTPTPAVTTKPTVPTTPRPTAFATPSPLRNYNICRYIRINRADMPAGSSKFINLVQLYVYDENNAQISLTAENIYSSAPLASQYVASKLIDEDNTTFFHSEDTPDAFVEVDLGYERIVNSIKIDNRIINNRPEIGNRIVGATVQFLKQDRKSIYNYMFYDSQSSYTITLPTVAPASPLTMPTMPTMPPTTTPAPTTNISVGVELLKNGNFTNNISNISLPSNVFPSWTSVGCQLISINNSYGVKIGGNIGSSATQGDFSASSSNYIGLFEASNTYTITATIQKIATTSTMPYDGMISLLYGDTLDGTNRPIYTDAKMDLSSYLTSGTLNTPITITQTFIISDPKSILVGKPIYIQIYNTNKTTTASPEFVVNNISVNKKKLVISPSDVITTYESKELLTNTNFMDNINNINLPSINLQQYNNMNINSKCELISFNNSVGILVHDLVNSGIYRGSLNTTDSSYIGKWKYGYNYTLTFFVLPFDTNSKLPYAISVGASTAYINNAKQLAFNSTVGGGSYYSPLTSAGIKMQYTFTPKISHDGQSIFIRIHQNLPRTVVMTGPTNLAPTTTTTQRNSRFVVTGVSLKESLSQLITYPPTTPNAPTTI
jgi:hypothetical protein